MNKLKTIIQYECTTSFKYIWYFYAIQYSIVTLITLIIGISTGSFEDLGTNALEMNTLIYIGILGVLGFKEDFKMLIQNGFTRKYIFTASLTMFAFISGIMALFDTIMGNVIHYLQHNYLSLYSSIYGYGNVLVNWLWLFLAYMLICTLLYLGVLVINKIGKTLSIYLTVILGGAVLLIVALFRFVLSSEVVNNIVALMLKAFGFMRNGTINYFFPVLTLLVLVGVLGISSYAVIRRTELR
ncbi:hypothetical protein [Vallitalea maricola]|uniref:ABC transporter permease n=1 Tax=Vallitalea maricola TaxID=3074433 RepID=A0ACB5UI67_9FIRM|nr:ABC transporter permease [Vallitalea sp. AN17-2]